MGVTMYDIIGVDYAMNEHSATKILACLDDHKPIPNFVLQNYITSSCSLLKNGYDLGPKSSELSIDLDSIYAWSESVDKPDFGVGAIFGALSFYKHWNELNALKENS